MNDRGWFRAGGWTVGLFIFVATTLRAEPQFEISHEPSDRVRMGETCQVTIRAIWRSSEGEFLFQRPHLTLERLAVEETGESSEAFQRAGEEWKRKTFRIVLRTTEAGTGRVGPFQLNYLDPVGQIDGHYDVSAVEWKISRNFSQLFGWLGASALAIGGGFAGWILFLRRRTKGKENQTAPPSIEERYASRLAEFEKGFPTAGGEREWIFEAGRLFRAYLMEKYSVSDNPLTHRELLNRLRSSLSGEDAKRLARLLDALEEWQYAIEGRASGTGQELCREMIRYVEGKKIVGV